jgi:uncharacterized protein YkwD
MINRVPTVTPARTPVAVEFGRSKSKAPLSQSLTRTNRRATASSSMATLEQSVFQQINQYRQQQGLAPLTLNSTITGQARQHSKNMANSRTLSHNGFNTRVQTISKTIAVRGAAENVAYNAGFSNPAAQAVNGWLKSSGHLKNIMGNYNLTGVGVAKNSQGEFYFTQIFIKR